MVLSTRSVKKVRIDNRGGSRIFMGGAEKRSPKSLMGGVLEAFGVFDALSCYLSLIFKHSDPNGGKT